MTQKIIGIYWRRQPQVSGSKPSSPGDKHKRTNKITGTRAHAVGQLRGHGVGNVGHTKHAGIRLEFELLCSHDGRPCSWGALRRAHFCYVPKITTAALAFVIPDWLVLF